MIFPLYDLNPHRRFPVLTLLVIAVNVAVTLWMTTLSQPQWNRVTFRYGFVPRRVTALDSGKPLDVAAPAIDRWGNEGVQRIKLSTDARSVYPTFITTMFLHGGWIHLLFNMWTLWIFGNNIEDRLGHVMYGCFYLLGGVLATLCHWVTDPQSAIPVVGASGAIAAVLGGYAITFPTAKIRTLVFFFLIWIVDMPALVFLGIWFAMQIISGIHLLPGVANQPVAFWAHIGGFVAGMVLMPLLSLGAAPPGSDWHQEAEELFRFDDPRTM